jgi:hypothetical protein
MTSKERVLATLGRQIPDRVPVNYEANPGIDDRLKAHFGLAADDHAGLQDNSPTEDVVAMYGAAREFGAY